MFEGEGPLLSYLHHQKRSAVRIEKQLKEIEGAGETWVLLRAQLHPRRLCLKAHCAVFTLDN